MSAYPTITAPQLAGIASFDTCAVSNAIERLKARMRNEGFMAGAVQCRFPAFKPMTGYAVTARVKTADPPMGGQRCYYDRMDWWNFVASVPGPRIMVLEDTDEQPGQGAFVGEIHAAIGQALHCIGCVTNGAVRDLPAVEAMGFHLFSGSVSPSHAYAHIVEFGTAVEIGGLQVRPGELLQGDRHGVQSIPMGVAPLVPAEAVRMLSEEKALIDYCKSSRFSLEGLARRLQYAAELCAIPQEGH